MIGDADAERSAGTAFADDCGKNRYPQYHHLSKIDRDRLRDVALFRTDARVGSGGIDERDDGQVKLLSESHDSQRLAISFGMGATKIAHHIFLGVAAFLVRHHDTTSLIQFCQPAWHRLIIGETAV